MGRAIRLVILGGTVSLAISGAAPAMAAPRYAAPTPAGLMNCSSPADACSFFTAVDGAGTGDEVIVAPGDYGSSGTPLTTEPHSFNPNVYIHGVLDQPRPRIFSSATFPLTVWGPGSTVRWLEIYDSEAGNGVGIDVFNANAEQVVVHRTVGAFGTACRFSLNTVAKNSVCRASSANSLAVVVSGIASLGPNTVTLRNLTAIGDGAGGIAVDVESSNPPGEDRSSAVTMINSIARGNATGFDVRVIQNTQPASITIGHSNYQTTSNTGGTITDDGTNQTAAPLFATPLAGNFHELSASPTINAGVTDAANGAFDLDGIARAQGASTDIGAYEFPVAQIQPVATSPGPQIALSSAGKLKRARNVGVTAQCALDCNVVATARLLLRGTRASTSKAIALPNATTSLKANAPGTLTFRLSKKAFRRLQSAKKASLLVNASATDALGSVGTSALTIKFKKR